MSDDIIELARRDQRSSEIGLVPFSVQALLQSVKEIVQPIAEEKGLDLTITPPEADWRIGQLHSLHRVLLNLTTNALKFTDSGFVAVSAKQMSRSAVEFSVSDSGRGLPAELLPHLFDAFRGEGEGGKVVFSSSGLGLAICNRFVRALGGKLHAENTTAGARFSFVLELPVADRL
jgi:signal transduction histidine kinase